MYVHLLHVDRCNVAHITEQVAKNPAGWWCATADLPSRVGLKRLSFASLLQDIKAAYECKTGVAADRQRLIFQSRHLNEEETLTSIGMPNGGTMYFIERLRGD